MIPSPVNRIDRDFNDVESRTLHPIPSLLNRLLRRLGRRLLVLDRRLGLRDCVPVVTKGGRTKYPVGRRHRLHLRMVKEVKRTTSYFTFKSCTVFRRNEVWKQTSSHLMILFNFDPLSFVPPSKSLLCLFRLLHDRRDGGKLLQIRCVIPARRVKLKSYFS